MKIRRFFTNSVIPDQTESCLTMKNGFSRTLYTFRNIQKLSEFPPIDFYGYTPLRGVGADMPPLGEIGLKGQQSLSNILPNRIEVIRSYKFVGMVWHNLRPHLSVKVGAKVSISEHIIPSK